VPLIHLQGTDDLHVKSVRLIGLGLRALTIHTHFTVASCGPTEPPGMIPTNVNLADGLTLVLLLCRHLADPNVAVPMA
jgi:hypothetical protein